MLLLWGIFIKICTLLMFYVKLCILFYLFMKSCFLYSTCLDVSEYLPVSDALLGVVFRFRNVEMKLCGCPGARESLPLC